MPRTTRSVLIQFRLRSDEAAALRAAAEAEGLSPGIYARRHVLDAASLAAIASRLAALPSRDDMREDLTHLAQRLAGALKPTTTSTTSSTNPAAARTSP